MEIVFLGTSYMMPTKKRNHTAILVTQEGENILVDCGEGTQRQFRKAGLNPCKITKLLITHWHGDHILGIPGLLQTLNLSDYSKTLQVYGPRGTSRNMEELARMFLRDKEIKIEVHEVEEGEIYNGEVVIHAYEMDHGVPCLAYTISQKTKVKINVAKMKKLKLRGPIIGDLQRGQDVMHNGKKVKAKDLTYTEEGKKIAFVLDTKINENCVRAAKDSDILICESTYMEQNADRAEEHRHLTAAQAGDIAKRAKAKVLYLTHISQRYEMIEGKMLQEAKKKFKKTILAEDLMRVEI